MLSGGNGNLDAEKDKKTGKVMAIALTNARHPVRPLNEGRN